MATRKEFEGFNCSDLVDHLSCVLPDEVGSETFEKLKKNKITGRTFLELDDGDLREVASLLGERKALKRIILSYKNCAASSSTQESASITVRYKT